MQHREATAPAKLNLYLHIHGKQADGYHRLESLVTFVPFGDRVRVEAAAGLTLTCEGEFADAAGGGEGNLVLRAARLLQQKSGCTRGAAITLTKRLPVGAGLGGGSSDAATVLHLLNQLWELQLPPETLCAWAPELGADVAMCIVAAPLVARGIGEQLAPLAQALPPFATILVHPRTPLLTADVYRALAAAPLGEEPASAVEGMDCAGFDRFIAWLAHQRNDLEPVATALSAEVAAVLAALRAAEPTPPLVRMSGSGACCYALYETAAAAQAAAAGIAARHPHWWVQVA